MAVRYPLCQVQRLNISDAGIPASINQGSPIGPLSYGINVADLTTVTPKNQPYYPQYDDNHTVQQRPVYSSLIPSRHTLDSDKQVETEQSNIY